MKFGQSVNLGRGGRTGEGEAVKGEGGKRGRGEAGNLFPISPLPLFPSSPVWVLPRSPSSSPIMHLPH